MLGLHILLKNILNCRPVFQVYLFLDKKFQCLQIHFLQNCQERVPNSKQHIEHIIYVNYF